MLTHEQFIHKVAGLAIARIDTNARGALKAAKLTYGAGHAGLRGVTYFDKWLTSDKEQAAFVEICSFGEQSPVQLAGTTIHELGHVLAGLGAGHSKAWKEACQELGLRGLKAAGTDYIMAMFDGSLRSDIAGLITKLEPAKPRNGMINRFGIVTGPRPCSMGIGTRGGTSRGVGSGSRLRKYVCECDPPIIVRASRDNLDCTCNGCRGLFKLA